VAVEVERLEDYEIPLDKPVNFYLVRTPSWALLVDTGTGKALSGARRAPRFTHVVLTHYHWDHSGGLRALASGRVSVKVCASPATIKMLEHPREIFDRFRIVGAAVGLEAGSGELALAKVMMDKYAEISEAARTLGVEDLDCLARLEGVEWLECKGHSSDHICIEVGGHLFVGDNIIGSPNVTLTQPYEYFESMISTLARPSFTSVHPGHGPDPLSRREASGIIIETLRRKRRRIALVAAAAQEGEWVSLRVVFKRVYPALDNPLLSWVAARSLVGYVNALEADGILEVDRSTEPWRVRVRAG
jgi:ribonuclease/clavin/mitogillin